jgi:hypothetical protein
MTQGRKLPLRIARNIRFQAHGTLTACWIWTGEISKAKGPVVWYEGALTTARSVVYRILKGKRCRLKNMCGEGNCVNPHHMEPRGGDVV